MKNNRKSIEICFPGYFILEALQVFWQPCMYKYGLYIWNPGNVDTKHAYADWIKNCSKNFFSIQIKTHQYRPIAHHSNSTLLCTKSALLRTKIALRTSSERTSELQVIFDFILRQKCLISFLPYRDKLNNYVEYEYESLCVYNCVTLEKVLFNLHFAKLHIFE